MELHLKIDEIERDWPLMTWLYHQNKRRFVRSTVTMVIAWVVIFWTFNYLVGWDTTYDQLLHFAIKQ